MTSYPLATSKTRHYAPPRGWKLVYMTPATFLSHAPPLGLPDPESSHYIRCFVEHIQSQLPLDAPELGLGREHDGRHRAHAARIAGVERLPVYVDPRLKEIFS